MPIHAYPSLPYSLFCLLCFPFPFHNERYETLLCVLKGFIWPMLVGSAVMGPRTPEHLTELEAFFRDPPKPVGAGER